MKNYGHMFLSAIIKDFQVECFSVRAIHTSYDDTILYVLKFVLERKIVIKRSLQ